MTVFPSGDRPVAAVARSFPAPRHALRLLPLAAAAFCWPMLGLAEEAAGSDHDNVHELDTVTVRAIPLGKTSDQLVQPTLVLDGDALDHKRRGTIGETLENEPGISTSDFGSGAARPIIRGQAGPRVEVMENGIGSLDVSDISPDHAVAIDTAGARAVEVLRGPATLLYGSRASGGVVNVINGRLPTSVEDGLHGVLDGQIGSNADDRNGSLELDYGAGHHQFHVDAAARKTGDFEIPGNARTDGSGNEGRLLNSRVQTNATALSYGYVDGGSSVSASISTFGAVYGLPSEEAAYINLDQTRYDAQGILDRPLPGLESAKLRAAYNSYAHIEFEAPEQPGTRFQNHQNAERLELVHVPVAGFRGVFGLQHDDRRFAAIGDEAFVPKTRADQWGLFVVEEKPWSLGKFEIGARINRDSQDPESGYRGRDFTPISFSVGNIFTLGVHDHVKLYFSRAQRSPATEELYAFGPHLATSTYERGLDSASLETANNFEIGYDHHDGRLSLESSVYFNSIEDYLFLDEVDQGLNADGSGTAASDGVADRVDGDGNLVPSGGLLLVDYRQANTRFYGIEGQVAYLLVDGPLKLTGRGFGDYVAGQVSGDGGDLPRITPARIGAGLDGSWRRFDAHLDYTRVLSQSDIASLETRTGGYNLLGLELAWGFKARAGAEHESHVYLRARNLLDEDARRHTSFLKDVAPQPGVSVFLGFRLAI